MGYTREIMQIIGTSYNFKRWDLLGYILVQTNRCNCGFTNRILIIPRIGDSGEPQIPGSFLNLIP